MSPSISAVAPELTQAAAALARWRAGALARACPGWRPHPRSPVVAGRRLGRGPWRLQGRGDPAPGLHPAEAAGGGGWCAPVAAGGPARLCRPDPGPAAPRARLLSHPAGPCLRLEWPPPLASEVAAVARSLWEAVA